MGSNTDVAPNIYTRGGTSCDSGICAAFRGARGHFHCDLALSIPHTGITALWGPSGSGKSTCLRAIAGLEFFHEGYCRINRLVWQDGRHFIPTHRRAVGMVFQNTSLFPHLSVQENLTFGQRRLPRGTEMPILLPEVVDLLGIAGLLHRAPTHLSGGEQQRVAIARALLSAPHVLLLDEPLSALDAHKKKDILPYLEKLQGHLSLPMLYVSHAPDEVMRLADHLVILENGHVIESGPLNKVLCTPSVMDSFGDEAGVVLYTSIGAHEADALTRLDFPGGHIHIATREQPIGTALRCRVHARDVSLARTPTTPDSSILNSVPATVVSIVPTQTVGHLWVQLRAENQPLVARITQRSAQQLGLQVGMPVHAHIKSVALLA